MQSSADAVFQFVMAQEGSALSTNRSDGGCWSGGEAGVGLFFGSKYGVTAQDLIAYMRPAVAYAKDMAALTEATAECIFHTGYYQSMRGDDLPGGSDLSLVDFGYNAGTSTSVRMLQTLVGANVDGWLGAQTIAAIPRYTVNPTHAPSSDATKALQTALGIAADGAFGPATRAALGAHPARNMLGLIAALSDAQAAHYRSLAQFPLYGNGWLARTWRRCAAGMALAAGSAPSVAAPVKSVPLAAVSHVQRTPDVVAKKPEYTSDQLDAIYNPTVQFTE